MNSYILLYHYSPDRNLTSIDPRKYGTGVTLGAECKRGKVGIEKSYYYFEDRPEVVVSSGATRYVIYMPLAWQDKIYDRSVDALSLYERVAQEIELQQHRLAYDYELRDGVEEKIRELGYKGWRVSNSQLPHVVVLFESLQTGKPLGDYQAYNWNGILVEEVKVAKNQQFFASHDNEASLSAQDWHHSRRLN